MINAQWTCCASHKSFLSIFGSVFGVWGGTFPLQRQSGASFPLYTFLNLEWLRELMLFSTWGYLNHIGSRLENWPRIGWDTISTSPVFLPWSLYQNLPNIVLLHFMKERPSTVLGNIRVSGLFIQVLRTKTLYKYFVFRQIWNVFIFCVSSTFRVHQYINWYLHIISTCTNRFYNEH